MNRRAHIRQNVDIPVHLKTGSSPEIPARAGDFSLGGLRVFTEATEAPELAPLQEGERVEVLSTVRGRRGPREVALSARVARVDGQGLGLRFESPDAIALLAFHNHVRYMADSEESTSAAPTDSKGRDIDMVAHSAAHTVYKLNELVKARLEASMSSLWSRAEEDLALAARDEGPGADGKLYESAMGQLAVCGRPMTRSFVFKVCSGIEEVALGAELVEPKAVDPSSLMAGDEEFKGWLAVKSMAARAESRFNTELLPLQMRLNELFRGSFGIRQNPLHPASVCRAFMDALRVTGLPPRICWIVFEAMDAVLIEGLGDLYKRANALLASEGVMPDLDMARLLGGRARA